MDKELGKRIVVLQQEIIGNFNVGQWEEVGLLTGQSETIGAYPRLLRSLSWHFDRFTPESKAVAYLVLSISITFGFGFSLNAAFSTAVRRSCRSGIQAA